MKGGSKMAKLNIGFNEKIVFAVVLVIALAIVFVFTDSKEKKDDPVETDSVPISSTDLVNTEISALEKSMEERISANLASIKGVGKTKVVVTLTTGLKREYVKDESITRRTSKESDKEGGVRETVEVTESNKLVLTDNSRPVLVIEQSPEVAGVLVIAQGAQDPKIKEQIFNAVKTLLDIQPSKINIAPLGG
jgi:stage III sporulation protein AG